MYVDAEVTSALKHYKHD